MTKKRKIVILLLLSAALEVTGLVVGPQIFSDKSGTGPAGRPSQVKLAKPIVEEPREAPKTDHTSPEGASSAEVSPSQVEAPSRNPFALPSGVDLRNQASGASGKAVASRDPARADTPASPGRELNGILVGARDRVAIIGGTLLRPGDSVEGERVIEIRSDYVVLARDGRRRTLRLPPAFPELEPGTGLPGTWVGGVQPKTRK